MASWESPVTALGRCIPGDARGYCDLVKDAAVRAKGVRWAACAVAVLVLAGDQASKSLVLAARPGPGGSGLVSVRLVRNTGASLGLEAGHPLLVVLVAVVIIAVVAVLLVRTRGKAAALCLAAVLGGALGNLADRLFRAPGLGRGAVVDWIHVSFYPATFNIADLAIRVGAVGAVIVMLGAGHVRRHVAGETVARP
jgi:signal peptidase II